MKRFIEGRSLWTAFTLALLAGGVAVSPVAGQDIGAGDRIIIMVPDLAPGEGVSDRFGGRVANELRELISELHTHQTVSRRDLDRARKEFKLSKEDLYNCVSARQLAMRKNWGLVLCGEYVRAGEDQVRVDAKFVGAQTGDEFAVPQFTAAERDVDAAASNILQTFDLWQTQLRHTVFCQQYMDSESWDRALDNCERALEIDPRASSALYMTAFILRETDRHEESLAMLDRLLDLNPIHQDALKLAGIVATEATLPERARDYFDRYMELNPGDVGVRLTIATDIANAGDPATAMEFARGGLEVAPDDMTLVTYIGHFAAQAAGRAEAALNAQAQGTAPAGPAVDSGAVRRYYTTAAEHYQRVFDENGSETEPQILERLTIALFKLGRVDAAVSLGSQAVELDPENAALWDAYSRALQEAGNAREALTALERAEEFGAPSASLSQRKAMLQLQLGNESDAVAILVRGVEAGHLAASNAFNIVFRNAYVDKYQKGQLSPALALLEAAGPLAVAEKDRLTRNFWRGYILFEQAKAAHEPMTAASAERAKPLFERALEMFQAAQGYEQYHASANVPQFIDQAQRFIEIEEALIKRGR